ncbi:MCE family protein [Dokdonia sinensis]|uniref:MCE family protein n=1 Tax=Dokdonia sinensis TaxID=2479847 RepID=A0A3M0GHT1_9FLAO|nr:MlaD family protein [Dokdonia sinensis]RMB64137.1 MCE family protein [Dokdonia sinensis]
MEKTIKQKTNLGVFVVIATTLLIVALYFIGNRQHLFEKSMVLKAQFYNVNGLQLGNNVRFSGIDVGTVSKINMTSDSTILIEMRIRRETTDFIRKNAVASIGSDGLVGNMIVNITPKKGGVTPVKTGDTLQTYSKIATDDMLSTLSVTNQNASLLTADLLKITTQILEGEGTLAKLLNDPKLANDLGASIAQIKSTSAYASQSLQEISLFTKSLQTEGSLAHTIFSDTVSGRTVHKIITDIEKSSENLVTTTDQLKSLVSTVESSKGTLDYIINDTLLPREISKTVKEIKESSQKLNKNMEALKHNFLLRGYFKKLEREARKDARKQAKQNILKDEN